MDVTKVKQVVEDSLSAKINDSCAQKLLDLSNTIGKPIENLVDEYEVFSMNENFKSITIESVNKFVRKMTPRKSMKPPKTRTGTRAGEQILNRGSPGGGRPKTDTLMATYGVAPKNLSPDIQRPSIKTALAQTPRSVPLFGNFKTPKPAPLTPSTIKFEGSIGNGQVVASLNGENITHDIGDSCGRHVNIEFYHPPSGIFDMLMKDGKFRYMFMDYDSIRRSSSERVTELGDVMKMRLEGEAAKVEMDTGDEEDDESYFFTSVDIPGNGVVHLLGRILYERLPGGAHQIMLEGDLKYSSGNRVRLDISILDKYSIFPGQTVVVKGVNTSGHEVVAQTIYDNFSDPCIPLDLNVLNAKWDNPVLQNSKPAPVIALAAIGPFTTSNTFEYKESPLQSFAKVVAKMKPAVLILLGPLIDIENPAVHTLGVTFQEAAVNLLNCFFHDCCLPGVYMQILIAPSIRDAHHDVVFPQPPYFDFENVETPYPDFQTIELICNPAQFWVNDFFFAVTSYDVLLPLTRQLTYLDRTGTRKSNKIELVCEHLIKQKSFYPALTGELLDRTFSRDLYFHQTPDVLITSTNLKYFAMHTPQGTAVLNPRTLARGNSGGAYCQLLIDPPQIGKTKKNRLKVEIRRI